MSISTLRPVNSAILKQLAALNSKSDDVFDKIIQYFIHHPNPDDFEIHKYAEELGLTPPEFEGYIYELLTQFIRCLGRHNNVPDSMFIKEQLELGINEELEHTDSQYIAKLIAKDHLSEDPLYYSHHDIQEARVLEIAEENLQKKGIDLQIRSLNSQIEHLNSMKSLAEGRIKMSDDPSAKAKIREQIAKHTEKQAKLRQQVEKLRAKKAKL